MLQNTLSILASLTQAKLIYQDKEITHKNIAGYALKLTKQLKSLNIDNQPICFCLPNSPELLCYLIACFYLGIPVVPIIYEQTPEFIHQVLNLINPSYFYITSEKYNAISKTALPKSCNFKITNATIENMNNEPDEKILDSKISSEKLAMIIFSSGTSGQLKGIMHSYKSAYGFIEMLIEVLSATEKLTYLIAQPMGHIGGIVTTLLTLFKNGTAILLEKFEVSQYMQHMHQYKPTHINLHTPLFYSIINYPNLNKNDFNHLTTSFAAGDEFPTDLPVLYQQKTGVKMQTGFGLTETGIFISNTNPYGDKAGSVGIKLSCAEVELRDTNNIAVGPNTIGEICVKSPACFLGYWNMPELNKQTLTNGWFKTGDLALRDNNNYYWYQGRANSIIYSGKHAIYPSKIENILFKHPDIKASAVIGVDDKALGHVPIAFVELKVSSKNYDQYKILDYLKSYLNLWEMPKSIKILDKLPLGLTGKIDRNKLQNSLK